MLELDLLGRMADENIDNETLLAQTTRIVAAYVSHNPITASELPDLMQAVHGQLKNLDVDPSQSARPDPAVPISKSVTRDHIVCLEDGKKLKMLKRYLRTRYDLTPDEYRERWGLPPHYPMVCPEYAERRSKFAKDIGLGKKA